MFIMAFTSINLETVFITFHEVLLTILKLQGFCDIRNNHGQGKSVVSQSQNLRLILNNSLSLINLDIVKPNLITKIYCFNIQYVNP